MNTTELLARWRRAVQDTEKPYLWSDEEVFGYMDVAQRKFCIETNGIADFSSPLTELPLYADVPCSAISPLILKVRSATLDGRPLNVVNHEALVERGCTVPARRGRVTSMVLGLEEGKVYWYETPATDGCVKLSIYRLPSETITDVGDQALEIPEAHHLSLLHWMSREAYLKHDADTYDPNAAERVERVFLLYCASVLAEQEKRKTVPRTVLYGGL